MSKIRKSLREHHHFIVVVTLLTLVMTYPTIVYIFRTDVFWLPTGKSTNVYTHLWDVWYLKQILSGQADRFYTTSMFYPEGVSLALHPFYNLPFNLVQAGLQSLMPFSNSFNAVFMLVIFSNALSAYLYGNWLFKHKWIALFGAVVFAFNPHVMASANQLHDGVIATIALSFYCFHRGIRENRAGLVILAGVSTGLTFSISPYNFVCLILMLAFAGCVFAIDRWRDRDYWRNIGLLTSTAILASFPWIYPLLSDSQALQSALDWDTSKACSDVVASFVNLPNPLLGPIFDAALKPPLSAFINVHSYLGYLPLLLICVGAAHRVTRLRMLPWFAGGGFLILRLGTALTINGVTYPDILLPKAFLDEIFPSVFGAFYAPCGFQIGLLLPLAVLSSYGIAALSGLRHFTLRPWIVLLFVAIVSLEYYVPVDGRLIEVARFQFFERLEEDQAEAIRIINLPMGRSNSKRYNLYQALSGYPHAEGAISRTPDSAFDYIRANPILDLWNSQQPIVCTVETRSSYLSALDQLEADGFSHVVLHFAVGDPYTVIESFQNVEPSYNDDFVSTYRLRDLRESCPS